MTMEQWAAKLNGREIRNEVSEGDHLQLKKDGLVVVFGASDDLMEFRGVIYDEFGCFDGGTALLTADGLMDHDHEEGPCDCKFCGYKDVAKARKIKALWCDKGYSWHYETDIPHATFDVMEDGEKYCRGIVFEARELQCEPPKKFVRA